MHWVVQNEAKLSRRGESQATGATGSAHRGTGQEAALWQWQRSCTAGPAGTATAHHN